MKLYKHQIESLERLRDKNRIALPGYERWL